MNPPMESVSGEALGRGNNQMSATEAGIPCLMSIKEESVKMY